MTGSIRSHAEAIRFWMGRGDIDELERARLVMENAQAILDTLEADKERYFNLNSEHGTDEVFAMVYDPDSGPVPAPTPTKTPEGAA